MTPTTQDSQHKNDQVLRTVLHEAEFKSKFQKILNICQKQQANKATSNFLKNCIEVNVIPNTFKIRNEPKQNCSERHKNTWTAGAKLASKMWMESSISELEQGEILLEKDFSDHMEVLLGKVPENCKIPIEQRILQKRDQFRRKHEKKKNKKLVFLLSKNPDFHRKNIPDCPPSPPTAPESYTSPPPKPPFSSSYVVGTETNPPTLPSKHTTPNTPSNSKRNRPGKRTRRKIQILKKSQTKKKITVVFNYSKITLTDPMLKLLNRGLNFCIKPLKVDLSKLLCDYKWFERKIRWKEFFHGSDNSDYKPPIFKSKKTNMPRNHSAPKGMQIFLNSIENGIQDKSLWNKQTLNPKHSNISKEEYEALQTLIKLQAERKITIKPADKGAGILVLDFEKYKESCETHLTATQLQPLGPPIPYYVPTNTTKVKKCVKEISDTVKKGLSKEWITAEEAKAMDPTDCTPGRFYMIFKVHKPHPPDQLPPGRPIVSGSGGYTENIAKFVDFHAKSLVTTIPSYLQDTPDFLRTLDSINKQGTLPPGSILVTVDVAALYTNIPTQEGLTAMQAALDQRADKTIPTEYLMELLSLVLKHNIFEFNKNLYVQNLGTAMGPAISPTYANIMMGTVDSKLQVLAKRLCNGNNPIHTYLRFLDDIFIIWTGSPNSLLTFLQDINEIHPTLKFTSSMTTPFTCETPTSTPHDCYCYSSKAIPYLDTLVSIKDGKLSTDLYRKETDRCQYLLPSSCHPQHITKNIPYSLAYRLVRICSERENLLKRFEELRSLLLSRDYHPKVIESAISRASLIPREEALKRVEKKPTDRVVFALDYHPALPSISKIIKSSWNVMIKDPYLKEVFPQPPMIAYRKPRMSSLRELLVRARVPPPKPQRPRRQQVGMKKCRVSGCTCCAFVTEGKQVNSSASNFKTNINKLVNCESTNVIYCISCQKSKCNGIQYIGETGRRLKDRISQHVGYIKGQQIEQPTGNHFNLPGHSLGDMEVTVIEKCLNDSVMYRQIRETNFINLFNSIQKGLNKKH